jgi:anti-sigma regulatory factor (Ser/Thr protein kinase)
VAQAEIELAADPASVAVARRFVGRVLREAGNDDDWAAVQIVSELSTNAIVHAGTAFSVRVDASAKTVRIEVTDHNPNLLAVQRHYSDDATTGRGIGMIEMLAERWGIDSRPGSKTIWCELVPANAELESDTDAPGAARPAGAADAADPARDRLPRPPSPDSQARAA